MKKTWAETFEAATPWVEFLQRDNLFDVPYSGNTGGVMVVTDANIANNFAGAQTDEFDYWPDVSESEHDFLETFEWDYNLHSRLRKKYNDYFGLESKNFNGADEKFFQASGQVCSQVIELMFRDIKIIFNCYANDYFPPLWKRILDVYLHDGFPCGWNGHYPEGRLVVFSNF
ncbi:MAG: hypothetical protein LBU11_09825 [Zoogloeaceae bacterium]|jgi:hypothetical protein|nr:hypothetical protein [Zoogloeaceae bacterium]